MLALRTLARYAVPLFLAGALVLAPIGWYVLGVASPTDADGAKHLYRLSWLIVGLAWIPQLALAGAAAPLARALAAGHPPSQVRALGVAVSGLGRAIVPCAIAVVAIAIGSLLVVPGLVLVVLLSLTATSEQRGMPAPLLDSLASVRARPLPVAIAVAAIVGIDLALAGGAYLIVFEPINAKAPSPSSLEAARRVVQLVGCGLLVVSPVAACVLATLRLRLA